MSDGPQLRQVQHPVSDVGAAVAFYAAAFGFAEKFTDGDRYAALDAGGLTLALVGAAEDVAGGAPAASIKVPDVAATLDAVVRAGGSVVRAPEQGPHETRAVVQDAWGNAVIVYGPR
ncbi:VOC family protein [Amycolatopsis sp. lyj-346]|uniref:VOC family protein n=1 Tax=Amycolatopsis sp. lyj-346 TaxID=2789289 RepID=UPI00397848C6